MASNGSDFEVTPNPALANQVPKVAAVHSTVWLLILVPPSLAYFVWEVLRSSPKVGFPSIPFRLGKHGFWIVLALTYVAVFAAALMTHRI